MITILSFDGGGCRGILSARILARLCTANPKFLDSVDVFAGTSTGGIIALGLANGLTPDQLVKFYWYNANSIFDSSWKHDISSVGELIGSDYDNKQLHSVLFSIFGYAGLISLKKHVVIPSFMLDNMATLPDVRSWKPKIFHNFPNGDQAQKIVDVAMSTSAAPTYFPSWENYIDGGVVLNNPSLAAVAQTMESLQVSIDDINLVSIGTGFSPEYIEGMNLDWGVTQWARPLIDILINGSVNTTHYICKQMVKKYTRIQPTLDANIRMDDTTKLQYLINFADTVTLPTLPA